MRQIDITTARKELTKLIESGEPVEITRHGKVVARLLPPDYHEPGVIELTHFGGISMPKPVFTEIDPRAAQRRRDELLNRINSKKKP